MNIKKTYNYRNFFYNKERSATIIYTIREGFETDQEAQEILLQKGQKPSMFSYVTFMNQVYAVGIESTYLEIVMGKDVTLIMTNENNTKLLQTKKIKRFNKEHIIKGCRSSAWNSTLAKNIIDLHQEYCEEQITVDGKSIKHQYNMNYITLLGMYFWNTEIGLFESNMLDQYFYDYPPSRTELWRKGVYQLHPFQRKTLFIPEYSFGNDCVSGNIETINNLKKCPYCGREEFLKTIEVVGKNGSPLIEASCSFCGELIVNDGRINALNTISYAKYGKAR